MTTATPAAVRSFWFSLDMDAWFRSGTALDATVRRRFAATLRAAERGELDGWCATPEGFVALVVVLDQFSRHVHRGKAAAYRNDARALGLARAHAARHLPALTAAEAMFALMPYQHATDARAQREGVRALARLVAARAGKRGVGLLRQALRHQRGHLAVLERFGRFPKRVRPRHRTPAERAYVRATPDVPY